MNEHNRINIRKTHPFLYFSILVFAIMCVALALNFWVKTPTFNPFDINKNYVGLGFFLIGAWQLFFLNVRHNLKMVRIGSAVSVFYLVAWGLGNMQQSLAGKASYQLPIVYFALAALHYLLLKEPPVNPMTEKKDDA